MMMQLGAEGVFVGSGIFKSGNPAAAGRGDRQGHHLLRRPRRAGQGVPRAGRGHGRHQRRGDPAAAPARRARLVNVTSYAWRSRRSLISSSSRSTSTAAASSARNRASCNGHSAATSPASRWCRRCGPSTRSFRCTRCTDTSCGPETPRRPRSSSSSACATAARSSPGGSTRSSTARPSSRCRRRSRPTRAESNTRTPMPSARAARRPARLHLQGRRSTTPDSSSSPSGTSGSCRAISSNCCPARHPNSRCGSGTATRCPTTRCCTSARWPT